MTNYLNLAKPQEAETNCGDRINSNSDKIDAECSRLNSEINNKANANHTHTGFALTSHTHSEIVSLTSRIALAESRINTLFSDKADKSYVINLLQNFDHSIAGLTTQINLNGQGSSSQSLRVNCWINSPAFLLEWHLTFHWLGVANPSSMSPRHTSEFIISKPGVNAQYWGGNTVTGITIKVKCRNPFLNNNWSNETTLTDNGIEMFNFLDADKIIAALAVNNNFQTTVASVIIGNPSLTERIISNVKHQTSQT